MTEAEQSDQGAAPKRRGRGATKPYPTVKFEDALVIAKTIVNEGVGDQMRRLTLFDRLGRSPDSGPSRTLVTASGRYGLTAGGYQAEHLTLTDEGKAVAARAPSLSGVKDKAFDCAIGRFAPFAALYENLKNQRVPAKAILHDELRAVAIPEEDFAIAEDIFFANARYVGLIRDVSGNDRVVPIEQLLEEDGTNGVDTPAQPGAPQAQSTPNGLEQQPAQPQSPADPSVHIDIQIHIASTAEAEQIDMVFASMAKHLYGREV